MPKMVVKGLTTIRVNCILPNLCSNGHQLHQKTGVNFNPEYFKHFQNFLEVELSLQHDSHNFLFLQNENLAYIFGNDCK